MRARKNQKVTNHSGSTFDSFLEEQGIREEVEAAAPKRVFEWTAAQLGPSPQEATGSKEKHRACLPSAMSTPLRGASSLRQRISLNLRPLLHDLPKR